MLDDDEVLTPVVQLVAVAMMGDSRISEVEAEDESVHSEAPLGVDRDGDPTDGVSVGTELPPSVFDEM